MSAFDTQFAALLEQHGLDSLSVHVTRMPDGSLSWNSYAHIGGLCGGADLYDPARSSSRAAITSAIEELNAKRTAAVDVPELEELAA